MKQPGQPPDRRIEPRVTKLSNHSAEFKIPGVPVYQLKVRDLSANGAGIVARTDSKILNMIRIGQELDVKLISFIHNLYDVFSNRLGRTLEREVPEGELDLDTKEYHAPFRVVW
jgi:hypothetical protein